MRHLMTRPPVLAVRQHEGSDSPFEKVAGAPREEAAALSWWPGLGFTFALRVENRTSGVPASGGMEQ